MGGGGGSSQFLGNFEAVRANLPSLRGEVLCNISPCETHFSASLPPDNYCTVSDIVNNKQGKNYPP